MGARRAIGTVTVDKPRPAPHVAARMPPIRTDPPAPTWRPRAWQVLLLVVAFFFSIVILRPWLNGASDAHVIAGAAWILFVAVVTVLAAVRAVI